MTATAVVLLIVKVSVVLAAALLAARVSRRAPARTRHGLWSVVFAAILILPLLASAVPELRVPVPSWAPRITQQETERIAPASLPSGVPAHVAEGTLPAPIERIAAPTGSEAVVRDDDTTLSIAQLLALIWVCGAGLAAGALMLALLRVAHLSRVATKITDAEWGDAAAQFAARLGLVGPVRLLMSEAVSTPMAGGVLRPTIFLPASALAWPAERRDVVLAHEIAHLAGRDPLRQILTRVAVAAYWFHPLAWMAARQSAIAREQACDEAVIALGTRPSTYARVLLEFADGLRPSVSGLAALPIVQRTLLEKRLMAILDTNRRPAARGAMLIPAALAVLTLSVAAAQPSQQDSTTAGLAQGIVAGVTGGVPGGVIGGVVEGVVAGVPGGVPGGVGDGVVGGVLGGVAGGVQASVCDWMGSGDFTGSVITSGRTLVRDFIHERAGRIGTTLVIQKTFGELRVCALADGIRQTEHPRPGEWAGRGTRVVLETQERNDIRRMEIDGDRATWWVNGQERPADAAAKEWAARVTDLLDAVWELRMLQGERSSLRGEISSILGQRSSLQGEISSLNGQVSSMQGEISSYRGQESSLRGEISSILGQVSSMQGEISSLRGMISSIEGSRWGANEAEQKTIADRIGRANREIAQVEERIRRFDAPSKIREVEKEVARLNVDTKIAEVEKNIREFDLESKVNEVRRRIAELDVDKKIAEVEKNIAALDVDRRLPDMERRMQEALKRLEAALARIQYL